MIKKWVRDIVDYYFPGHVGIMLIGSQAKNTEINPAKDCDVLLLHPAYSRMYNKKLLHEGLKLDFTVMPLCDTSNIIYNESNDIHGVLATMVSQGCIIFDTNGITNAVQQYVLDCYTTINPRTKQKHDELQMELTRMASRFGYEMEEHERVFLVCEFVSSVLSVEAIRLEQNLPRIKRKARILYAKQPELSKKLAGLVKEITASNNLKALQDFWASYKNILANGIVPQPISPDRILFDISFEDFSLPRFVGDVLKQLHKNPLLESRYQYYYSSLTNYSPTYKNKVCICFKTSNPEDILGLEDAIKATFGNALPQFEHSIIYPKLSSTNKVFSEAIEELRKFLCNLHTEMLNNNYNVEDRFLMAIILCGHVLKELRLGIQDVEKANLFLAQRFMFTVKEQRETWPYALLEKLGAEKKDKLKLAFSKKNLDVLSVMGGVFGPENDMITLDAEKKVIEQLKFMAANKHAYKSQCDHELSILGHYAIAEQATAFVYTTITEQILQMLCLTNEQKKHCLCFLAEGIKYG